MSRRVVITGMGTVNPLGNTVQDSWSSALEGRSGIGPITLFDTTDAPVRFAGEVKALNLQAPLGPFKPDPNSDDVVTMACNPKEARKVGRFIQLSYVAALEAYADSGLDPIRSKIDSKRFGINIGVGMGGLPEIEAVHSELLEKGYRRVTPFFIPQVIPNLSSGNLSILLHLQGPNLCNVTACSSSAHSIGESAKLIQRGDADLMMAGGAEAVICKLGIAGFASMKALSTKNETPEKASRPFDQDRDGFVMGEGSAIMILEEYEHAKKRGAKIYAEVLGYGSSGDAYHITSPSPEGEGGRRAMEMALKDAHLDASEVDYINAHGTSTPAGDTEEALAIAKTFLTPSRKRKLHVSSTKSMTGHLLGAAGALEGMFSVLAIRDQVIPPTINLEKLDEKCASLGLDYTANKAVKKEVHYTLSNSFGFGGTNASLLFGKVK